MLIYLLLEFAAMDFHPGDPRSGLNLNLQHPVSKVEETIKSVGHPALVGALMSENYPSAPEPKGNYGYWAGPSDYPEEAMRNGWEGVSGFELEIDKDGKVTSCTITQRSDYEVLDLQTCSSLEKNASFRPARDKRGRAIAGKWRSKVRWALPKDPSGALKPPAPIDFRFAYTIGKDGSVSDCKAEVIPAPKVWVDPCQRLPTYEPYVDEDGLPISRRVVQTIRSTVSEVPDVDPNDDRDPSSN